MEYRILAGKGKNIHVVLFPGIMWEQAGLTDDNFCFGTLRE